MPFGTAHLHLRKSTFSGHGGPFRTTRNFMGAFQNRLGYRSVANLKGWNYRRYQDGVSEDRDPKSAKISSLMRTNLYLDIAKLPLMGIIRGILKSRNALIPKEPKDRPRTRTVTKRGYRYSNLPD